LRHEISESTSSCFPSVMTPEKLFKFVSKPPNCALGVPIDRRAQRLL
jgi:hypothetical protein